jgi:hypothetical protein
MYVAVDVHFGTEGKLHPLRIFWEDGRNFEVQRVIDISRAESLKASGSGLQYRCIIGE